MLRKIKEKKNLKIYRDSADKSFKIYAYKMPKLGLEPFIFRVNKGEYWVTVFNEMPFKENELYDRYFLPAKKAIEARINDDKSQNDRKL